MQWNTDAGNMRERGEPELIQSKKSGGDFTKVTFTPDLLQFGITPAKTAQKKASTKKAAASDADDYGASALQGSLALMRKRVLDVAACLGPSVGRLLDASLPVLQDRVLMVRMCCLLRAVLGDRGEPSRKCPLSAAAVGLTLDAVKAYLAKNPSGAMRGRSMPVPV